MNTSPSDCPRPAWKVRLHQIIFEADTPTGRTFDVLLIICILASVGAVMLDSVRTVSGSVYGEVLYKVEWGFTLLFTVEYILRLLAVRRPLRYARSFFGIVDLLSILPTYLSLFIPGSQYLLVIRVLRVLRIFRILKLANYVGAAGVLMDALRSSRTKITVFLFSVLLLVVVLGSCMYLIEGGSNGFTNIPISVYWAIVTLTTVGYGDIAPQTPLGQMLAAVIMIIGYGIIAVPTGIVTAELVGSQNRKVTTRACPDCSGEGHDLDAVHCKFCGARMNPEELAPETTDSGTS